MKKKLSEMSLEELWQLFPIILTKHQEGWKEWYLEEERLLKNILPQVEKISHIGSTAIPAIWAKPIIDILVEVPKESKLLDYKALLENNGYICMSQSEDGISFNKGYTENGCRSTRPIYKKMTKTIYLWRAQKDGPNDVNDGLNYRRNVGQK